MKFTFIYPYREINSQSLSNDTLTMLEYTSLRFANYLAFSGCDITIYSENGKKNIENNISYDNILSAKNNDKNLDNLITIDTFDHLDIQAKKKYTWLSSSIDNISLRENSVNIIKYDVKIITFKELGGDFEISYPIMEIDSDSAYDFNFDKDSEYAITTTNPQHRLQEIIDQWDSSLIDLYIVAKSLHDVKIPDDVSNIKVIYPKNCDHMAMIIKNARFHISPQLPQAVFNSFAIVAQYYGVPTLSYNYKYNYILHKNNMAGINIKNLRELKEYISLLSNDNDMISELSNQAIILRSDLDMEKIFIELSKYFNVINIGL